MMAAKTSIKVSAETRDRLARVAGEHFGGSTLDHALSVILAEHERRVAEIQAWYEARPELMAEIRELASGPVSEMIPHRDVVAMFESGDEAAA